LSGRKRTDFWLFAEGSIDPAEWLGFRHSILKAGGRETRRRGDKGTRRWGGRERTFALREGGKTLPHSPPMPEGAGGRRQKERPVDIDRITLRIILLVSLSPCPLVAFSPCLPLLSIQ
jgi:hypothetical protein